MVRLTTIFSILCCSVSHAGSWQRHTIDRSSRGADGVKFGDFDRDGFEDIVTGWEEGGRIRICFQPGDLPDRPTVLRSDWESVTVGKKSSPEDAVPFDVNGDGWLDVVSCCEGATKNVFFHLNPGDTKSIRAPARWTTQPLEGAAGVTRWMFAAALNKCTLVLGSKAPVGQISLCEFGTDNAQWQKLRTCGWIMSLRIFDIDHDGHNDILYSDRKGSNRQVGWLKNPGISGQAWSDHLIGGRGREVMFLDIAEQPKATQLSTRLTIACHTKNGGILVLRPFEDVTQAWRCIEVPQPAGTGSGKGVALGDVDLDGVPDVVCTCEHAGDKVGVYWMRKVSDDWAFHDISGRQSGTKFDRIELIDLDLDGDLDVVTCEERNNLGVIWYENPTR